MLVVRVKRSRDDEPAGTLCLVESSNNGVLPSKKKKKLLLTDLSLNQRQKEEVDNDDFLRKQNNFLVLKHISTINHPIKQQLDSQTMGLVSKKQGNQGKQESTTSCEPIEAGEENRISKRQKLIVSQGKVRSLPRPGEESCIIVDMLQVYKSSTNNNEKKLHQTANHSSVISAKPLPLSPSKVLASNSSSPSWNDCCF
jgi:hypothetical protein